MDATPSPTHRTVALVGGAGSGKTTLAEGLLFRSGAIPRRGAVEQGTTVCDHDEVEKRHRGVMVIDFEHTDANAFHVSWEWTLKPPARKGNRADVMFTVNGVPVCIVEHKNPKDGDAIERGIKQLRRYEI